METTDKPTATPVSPARPAVFKTTQRPALIALGISLLALILSVVSLLAPAEEGEEFERLQVRVACLELDGANDCGADIAAETVRKARGGK